MSFSSINIHITFTLALLVCGFGYHMAAAHEVDLSDTTVVHMYDDRYEPRDVTITAGETIIFENSGEQARWPASNIHPTHRGYPGTDIDNCDTPDEPGMFDACREIQPNATYTFTFDEAGTWPYHDHLDARINGTITVLPVVVTEDEVGWLQKIKDWFIALWASLFGDSADVEEELAYDTSIQKDSSRIVSDTDALYSYVRKFGTAATLDHLTSLETDYGSCHDPAHDVGRFAYEAFGKDAFQECSMGCHSGCYHGAVEAYFREYGTTNLEENINDICSASDSKFVTHQCLHGLGHGLVAWSNYQLFEALDGCDLLDEEGAQTSCYGGVFMENIVQSMTSYTDIEGHTTEYISDDPHYPCTIVDDKYLPHCYFLQTDRMLQLSNGDFGFIANTCSEVDDVNARRNCFFSMGRTNSGQQQKNPEKIISNCNLIKDTEDRKNCLTGAIQDTFWDVPGKDDGLAFCAALESSSDADMCYTQLFVRAPQILVDIASREAFCSEDIPVAYQAECREIVL